MVRSLPCMNTKDIFQSSNVHQCMTHTKNMIHKSENILVFLNAAYDMRTTPSTVSVSREYFIIIIPIKMRGLNFPIKDIRQFE